MTSSSNNGHFKPLSVRNIENEFKAAQPNEAMNIIPTELSILNDIQSTTVELVWELGLKISPALSPWGNDGAVPQDETTPSRSALHQTLVDRSETQQDINASLRNLIARLEL